MWRAAAVQIAIVPSLIAISLAADPSTPETNVPIYSPWQKSCLIKDNELPCLTGSGTRLACNLSILVAGVDERAEEPTKILVVSVPINAAEAFGIRIAIDHGEQIAKQYKRSEFNRRTAEFEADANLIAQLKSGRILRVDVADSAGDPVTLTLPLAGFTQAFDGPGPAPRSFERIVSKEEMREMLLRSAEESHRRAERQARMNSLNWPRCD